MRSEWNNLLGDTHLWKECDPYSFVLCSPNIKFRKLRGLLRSVLVADADQATCIYCLKRHYNNDSWELIESLVERQFLND